MKTNSVLSKQWNEKLNPSGQEPCALPHLRHRTAMAIASFLITFRVKMNGNIPQSATFTSTGLCSQHGHRERQLVGLLVVSIVLWSGIPVFVRNSSYWKLPRRYIRPWPAGYSFRFNTFWPRLKILKAAANLEMCENVFLKWKIVIYEWYWVINGSWNGR